MKKDGKENVQFSARFFEMSQTFLKIIKKMEIVYPEYCSFIDVGEYRIVVVGDENLLFYST